MKKKIERIILFGDSFVEGQGTYDPDIIGDDNVCGEPFTPEEHDKLRQWRKKNSWEKFLKKHYPNVSVVNHATQGCDNYGQFHHLNNIIHSFKDTDLILFGFTSKYRDTISSHQTAFKYAPFLDPNSPLVAKCIAFEELSIKEAYQWDGVDDNYFKEENKKEIEFTTRYLKKHLVHIFDETVYENMAQSNYLFYEEYIKEHNLNFHFFDLFEPYVTPSFVKTLDIDTKIYLTYGEDDVHTYINTYERENGKYRHDMSYWECQQTQPLTKGTIHHPNQHGYELWIDYMYNRWLSKWYE